MIERQTDAGLINRIVNHPDVLPHVSGPMEGPLDLSALIEDQRNVALFGEHGGIMFHYRQGGIFEAHTMSTPEGRGRWTLAMAKEALRWMFVRTDCLEVITRVPVGNVAATALTRACGLTPIVTMLEGWETKAGRVDCTVHGLVIQNWMALERAAFRERGEWLLNGWRDCLIKDPEAMGLAYEMLLYGQGNKSAIFLKRWTAIAGSPVDVVCVSQQPPRLMIGEQFVVVRGEKKFTVF